MTPIPQLTLQRFTLDGLSFEANDEFTQAAKKTTVGMGFVASRHDTNSKLFRLQLRLAVRQADNDEPQPYELSMTISGFFESADEMEGKYVPQSKAENGLAILYGLARGLVANSTGSSPHGTFLLPTITFAGAAANAKPVHISPEPEKEIAMAKDKTTSPRAAKAASKVLRSPSSNKSEKTAAGSALSQKPSKKR